MVGCKYWTDIDPQICIFDDSFMQVISLTSTIDDGNVYRFVTATETN